MGKRERQVSEVKCKFQRTLKILSQQLICLRKINLQLYMYYMETISWSVVKQWVLKYYMYLHIIFKIIFKTKVKFLLFKSCSTKSKIKQKRNQLISQNLKSVKYLIYQYATVEDFIKISEKSRTVSVKTEAKQFASFKWPWVNSIKFNV